MLLLQLFCMNLQDLNSSVLIRDSNLDLHLQSPWSHHSLVNQIFSISHAYDYQVV